MGKAEVEDCLDAGRSAIAILRYMRSGNHQAAMDLTATLTPEEKAHLLGSMTALANAAFNCLDDVMTYSRTHGLTEMTATSADVLDQMAANFTSLSLG